MFPRNPKRSLTCLSRMLCFLTDIQVLGTEQTDGYVKPNNFLLFCQISIPMRGQEKELWNELSSWVLWLLLFFSLHTGHLRPGHLSCQCNLMPISLVTEKVMRCHHPLLLSYTFTKWKYNSRKNITGLYMKRWKKTDLKSVATAGLLGKMALRKMKAVLHEVSVMGWIVFPRKEYWSPNP